MINAVDITADHFEAVDADEDAVEDEAVSEGVGDIPSLIQINIIQNPITIIKIKAGIIEEVPEREDGEVEEVKVEPTKKLTKRSRNVTTLNLKEIKIQRQSHIIKQITIIIKGRQTQSRSYAGIAIALITSNAIAHSCHH